MNKGRLILLVGIALLLFLAIVVFCIHLSPVFTYCVIIIFLLSLGFIATESWFTHAANEFENRFWSGMALFFSCTCVFAPDSPLRFKSNTFTGVLIVFTFTYFVHIYDRHLRRIVLSKVPNVIKRIRSAEFGSTESRLNAQQKLNLLRKHLDVIDQKWLSSTFQNIFLLPRVLRIEHEIETILKEVPKEQLNFILAKIELGRIFYKVKDHRIARYFNRTKLLELLARTRLNELTIHSKAMLLHAFQIMKLSAHPLSEYYVREIIKSTKEGDLTELKCITDSKGDVYSMHKLIYEDVRDKAIQHDILRHISHEAKVIYGHIRIGSKKGKKGSRLAWKKILSDVDDTLTCSGGSYPAGVDSTFPKKAVYPGVLAFYRELDLGVTGDEEWNEELLGNLVFLSARPHLYKDVAEGHSYEKFLRLQQQRGLYTSPTLLAGNLNTGSQFILKDTFEPLAENKYRKLSEFITIYPEYTCIFIGDNGQGDVRTAEMVFENTNQRNNLDRMYVHEVIPIGQTYTKYESTRNRRTAPKLCYFKTYVDAAVDAYNNNLIRISGLNRIMHEAVFDFEYIKDDEWRQCDQLFCSSLSTTAKNVSQKTTLRPSNPLLSRRNHTQIVYETQHDLNLRQLNDSLSLANNILVRKGLKPVRLLRYKRRFNDGTVTKTPYGKAIVTRFRPKDGFYEVLLQWDGTGQHRPVHGYFQACSLEVISLPTGPAVSSSGEPVLASIAHNPNLTLSSSSQNSASAIRRLSFTLSGPLAQTASAATKTPSPHLAPSAQASPPLDTSPPLQRSSVASWVFPSFPTRAEVLKSSNITTLTPPITASVSNSSSVNISPDLPLIAPNFGTLQFREDFDTFENYSTIDPELSALAKKRDVQSSRDRILVSKPATPLNCPSSISGSRSNTPIKMLSSLGVRADTPIGLGSGQGIAVVTRQSPTTRQAQQPISLSSSQISTASSLISIFVRPPTGQQSIGVPSSSTILPVGNSSHGLCWTPYGIGKLIGYRSKDDMLIIRIDQMCFFNLKSDVVCTTNDEYQDQMLTTERRPIMTVYIHRLKVVQITLPQNTTINSELSRPRNSSWSYDEHDKNVAQSTSRPLSPTNITRSSPSERKDTTINSEFTRPRNSSGSYDESYKNVAHSASRPRSPTIISRISPSEQRSAPIAPSDLILKLESATKQAQQLFDQHSFQENASTPARELFPLQEDLDLHDDPFSPSPVHGSFDFIDIDTKGSLMKDK